jgi:cell wall-associated NlpC family hydrolase
MEKYICENVFVPLRSGPSHKSEMLSQVLFGEKYHIIDNIGHWIKIESCFDNYQGWLDSDHLQQSEDPDNSIGHILNRSLLCFKNDKLVLEAGCELFHPDFNNKAFSVAKNIYTASPEFSDSFITVKETIADTAMRFINSPYIWGGRIPSGIDCSGFIQLIYKLHGINIPRDSLKQAETGIAINFLEETRSGDLVFFDNERGIISHVGLIISQGLIIHCSGRVRIDPVDHQGIYKQETGRYSHHLRLIKRITG